MVFPQYDHSKGVLQNHGRLGAHGAAADFISKSKVCGFTLKWYFLRFYTEAVPSLVVQSSAMSTTYYNPDLPKSCSQRASSARFARLAILVILLFENICSSMGPAGCSSTLQQDASLASLSCLFKLKEHNSLAQKCKGVFSLDCSCFIVEIRRILGSPINSHFAGTWRL